MKVQEVLVVQEAQKVVEVLEIQEDLENLVVQEDPCFAGKPIGPRREAAFLSTN